MEYREKFLEEMKKLLSYFVEFGKDGSILPKEYPEDCTVGGPNRQPIIMITYDESTFSANDGHQKVWTLDGHEILRPKSKGRSIMVLDFLLPWSRLNLASLPPEKQKKLAKLGLPFEAAIYFEYGKMEERYWTGNHLLDQIQNKALPIGEALYLNYELLFMFDNATSHAIYAKDALQVGNMNKGSGGQQPFLRPGWYTGADGEIITQQMCYLCSDPQTSKVNSVQKGIQAILIKRGLWPQGGVRLECDKPKCSMCQAFAKCTSCKKGKSYDLCKQTKECSGNYIKQCICDAFDLRKRRCQCTTKQYYTWCKDINLQKLCSECEKISPKCTSEGK